MFGFSCFDGSVFHQVLSWPYGNLMKNIFLDTGCGTQQGRPPTAESGELALHVQYEALAHPALPSYAAQGKSFA